MFLIGGVPVFFTLILENENGDQVDMTATANQYMTSKTEGLNPQPGTISPPLHWHIIFSDAYRNLLFFSYAEDTSLQLNFILIRDSRNSITLQNDRSS